MACSRIHIGSLGLANLWKIQEGEILSMRKYFYGEEY